MQGPELYRLPVITGERFEVLCPKGKSRFSGLANSLHPKLYVISESRHPIYVGMTSQRLGTRLSQGFRRERVNGYGGYAWRHTCSQADLHVWASNGTDGLTRTDFETIEAELVFLIRQAGQWPAAQTEIHFHQSSASHRAIASTIAAEFDLTGPSHA